jgi:iron complex transport system ATP-binding protein
VVLHDLDWTAGHRERWVVLGPNGSGKTSILRLLSFQRAPSSGAVTVLGDTYGAVDVRTARRRVGLASSALLQRLRPTLTAHDVVVMGRDAALEPWWSTYSDAEHDHADALLEFVGCGSHARQEIATLSEGERKRLLVARVLMADPELLLRAGTVVAAGPIATTLTSEAVSATFGLDVAVDTDGERWAARLSTR